MKDEIKEILDDLRTYKDRYEYFLFNNLSFSDRDYKAKILLDHITNLQTIEQQYSVILSENAELENKITNLQDTLKDREEYCYGLETQLTDLQEEVKSANESITWWTNRFNALQEENKILKENAIHNDKVVDKARWNEMIYKSRNEKAIEFLEHEQFKRIQLGFGRSKYLENIKNKTIDILKGEDKDGNN